MYIRQVLSVVFALLLFSNSAVNNNLINRRILFTNSYQGSIFQEQTSKEQVMGWVIIDYLSPYMKKSLKDYYRGDVSYLGAHNPIGLDNFTFKINIADNKVTLERYEHVKSFKIPEPVKRQHQNLNLQ